MPLSVFLIRLYRNLNKYNYSYNVSHCHEQASNSTNNNFVTRSRVRGSRGVVSLIFNNPKRLFCTKSDSSEVIDMSGRPMRVLNVAEKNDAAKRIAALLSGGNSVTVSYYL